MVEGAYLDGPSRVELLWDGEIERVFTSPRYDNRHTHGTGHRLASATASRLALGDRLVGAVGAAKEYVPGAVAVCFPAPASVRSTTAGAGGAEACRAPLFCHADAVSVSGGTVTISASYGAGGSAIAPAVADALGLPFFDRAIPAAVASKLAVPLREAEQKDETVESRLVRLISSMAVLPDVTGRALAYRRSAEIGTFKIKTEEILNEIASGTGGVILGRAAAVVLADAPYALHVRLDGPPEGRVAALVRRGRDERVAREEQRANDAARTAYVRHFYRCDPAAARHYHLVIDTTVFGWEPATDLVVAAARARGIGA